jgi:hypothetical protein
VLPVEQYDQAVRVEWKLIASKRADKPDIKNVALADAVGVNVNTITRWLADPLYQRYENFVLRKTFVVTELTPEKRDVMAGFLERSDEMQDRLYGIIQQVQDPKLEASLCQDWLDRAGYAPQRKVSQSQQRPMILTGEAMEVFLRRAQEAGLTLPPITIDIEAV